MNKFFTKVAALSIGLAMAIGVGVAVGGREARVAEAATSTIEFVAGTDTSSTTTLSKSPITVTTTSGTFSRSDNYRIYASNSMTVTTSTGNITAMSFTITQNDFTADVGTWTSNSKSWAGSANSVTLSASGGQVRITSFTVTYDDGQGGGGDPTTYTGVTVSEKTPLTGTYKGDAYYECQAAVTGTGSYSSAVTWSITNSSTYGTGTSIANKASIDSDGKITFLDNCTVYAWATAADNETHNTTVFSIVASGLVDNPISSWTLITDNDDVSVNNIYALSNNGTYFGTTGVESSKIALTTSYSSIGYFALESTTGGYNLRFATYNTTSSEWEASGKYVNYSGSSTNLSSSTTSSTVWTLQENGNSGVFLRISGGRHLGIDGTSAIKAYANSNIGTNLPVYLYEVGSLPVVECAEIELTGAPSEEMSIGDSVTLGYSALDSEAEEWTGDVVYTISNESTSGVVELSATSGASVTLTAKKAGTATVSVQDEAGNADPDSVVVTVLSDPTRIDLPVGTYTVTISGADETSTELPASRDYEIKAKEGSGAGRVWYKNLTVVFSNITVITNYDEYESAKTNGALTVTNNSNATITNVEVHYYKYLNDGVGIYVNDSILTPTSSTGTSGTDNDLYRGYTNINGNTFALCNKNSSYTNKFYSVTITLTVADESEEFLSLVVSKSASWSTAENGTYKNGQAPTNSGLVVTANYTQDGSTISRSEEVTSTVSNWAYSTASLSTGDTSFSVVATWSGHDSASFTVTGISVTDITGPIESGRYYIMNSDKTVGLSAVAKTDSSPAGVDLSEANQLTAFDVTLKDDNKYEISVTIENTKYVLVCNTNATSSSNTQIRVTNSPSGSLKSTYWSLDNNNVTAEGAYHVGENTTGSYTRYLSYYSGGPDWRGYLTTGSGDPEIQFVAEGSYATSIAEAIMSNESPLCNGGSTAPSVQRWNEIAGITHIQHELGILTGTEAAAKDEHGDTPVGTDAEKAMARYDEIMIRYNTKSSTAYVDFLGRIEAKDLPIKNANVLSAISDNNSVTLIIIVASIVSLTAIGGYFLFKKKKQY